MAWVELGLFVVAFFFVTTMTIWLLGSLYGLLLHRPAVYFPFSLAASMALATFVGAFVLGFGAIIAATAVFVYEFKKRDDFVMWQSLLAGTVISIITLVVMYFAFMFMAWELAG